MANHSLIHLKRRASPEQVEAAFTEVNQRRFKGRLRLTSDAELTTTWGSARAWLLEAPDTRPKEPGPCYPDEDLGFCFWLHKDGRWIESRHAGLNSWVSWVQHIFEHEFAKHFGVKRFDSGDGLVPTDPDQFKTTFYDWATRNFDKPLSKDDADFLQRRMFDHVPEGWA